MHRCSPSLMSTVLTLRASGETTVSRWIRCAHTTRHCLHLTLASCALTEPIPHALYLDAHGFSSEAILCFVQIHSWYVRHRNGQGVSTKHRVSFNPATAALCAPPPNPHAIVFFYLAPPPRIAGASARNRQQRIQGARVFCVSAASLSSSTVTVRHLHKSRSHSVAACA